MAQPWCSTPPSCGVFAVLAALLDAAETVPAPFWVAVVYGERPDARTVVGGLIVLSAIICYLGLECWRQRRA